MSEKTKKSGKCIEVEQSQPCDSTSVYHSAMSTTGSLCFEEPECTSADHTSTRSKDRKTSSGQSLNGVPENVELSGTIFVGFIKEFVMSVLQALTEWSKPWIDILVTKMLFTHDCISAKFKHAYSILMMWIMYFVNIFASCFNGLVGFQQ